MASKKLNYIRKQMRKQYGVRTKIGVRTRGDGKKYYEVCLPLEIVKQMGIKEGDFLLWKHDPLTHIFYIKIEEKLENDEKINS